mmetsp:Transcript_3456/g.5090  ORF Transcript_3456/g.5090 Transcript_3456/m.5090 type:complete len:820 (-) Transcript_3456:8-2467(-)
MNSIINLGPTKLKDLIRQIRDCKTQAEEREIVATASSEIRTNLKDPKNRYRSRTVSKLMYINMLGYDTFFGQVECINLITSSKYPEKRIGYLALMTLLDEKQEILPLIEHSLNKDLSDSNQFVQALALTALGNIASEEICQSLSPRVEKLLGSSPFIKKKACLVATRIIQKCPDLVENYFDRIGPLLKEEHNHGVLLGVIALINQMIDSDPRQFRKKFRPFIPLLMKKLNSLIMSRYALEHDVYGISDPFLQVKILSLLRRLGRANVKATQMMSDLLAQVSTNTEGQRAAGHCIIYELINTILNVESERGLRSLAIDHLSKFLVSKNNNLRYVSLNTLIHVVEKNPAAVYRHLNTILDCLYDADSSIRVRAFELLLTLVTESNVETLARELLTFLSKITAIESSEDKVEIVTQIFNVIQTYGTSTKFKVEHIVNLIENGAQYITEDVGHAAIALITQEPDLHAKTVTVFYKKVMALLEYPLRMKKYHQAIKICLWVIGEYDTYDYTEMDIITLFKRVLRLTDNKALIGICLFALAKLHIRFEKEESKALIQSIIQKYSHHEVADIQNRSCEFLVMMRENLAESLIQEHPAYEFEDRRQLDETESVSSREPVEARMQKQQESEASIESILVPMDGQVVEETKEKPSTQSFSLEEFFGGSSTTTTSQVDSSSTSSILDEMMDDSTFPTPIAPENSSVRGEFITFCEVDNLRVELELVKPDATNDPSKTHLTAWFSNANDLPVPEFALLLKNPRYIQMDLFRASGSRIPGNSTRSLSQLLHVTNEKQGEKPIVLKFKFKYRLSPSDEMKEVEGVIKNIPKSF